MTTTRWFLAFALVLANLPLFAQKPADDEAAAEKQRQRLILADGIVADSRELRLPENRAIIFAKIGSRIWDVDQKRAQDLFQDAVTELIAAQAEAETEKTRGRQSELLTGQNTRPQVLQTIAGRDADFALRSLHRTRPAAVERAMLGAKPKDQKIRDAAGGYSYLVQGELSLEQNIARQAADQNPERAVALLQAALKRGITGEALSLLRKLHEKDPSSATEMGSDVIAQLMRKNLVIADQPDYNVMQTSVSFLSDHVRQRPATDKSFRFAAGDMKSLADKLITFILDPKNLSAASYGSQLIPIAEHMRPDAVERLKELGKVNHGWGLRSHVQDPEMSRLLNSETPVEEMLAKAPKLPMESRRQVYHNAANRLVAQGDVARAREVISENFSDDALVNAQESLNWYYAHQLTNQGKFAEAEALIDEFPEGNRFSALISLADAIYNRNQAENKSRAIGVLSKAAAGIPARPENNNEMQQTIQLIAAYTRIEPSEAFRILDSLVPQINELAEASVIVSGFQGQYNFRRGEMLIANGNAMGVHLDGSLFRGLAQKDFDRTMSLIGSFSRREMRVSLKQQLLDYL